MCPISISARTRQSTWSTDAPEASTGSGAQFCEGGSPPLGSLLFPERGSQFLRASAFAERSRRAAQSPKPAQSPPPPHPAARKSRSAASKSPPCGEVGRSLSAPSWRPEPQGAALASLSGTVQVSEPFVHSRSRSLIRYHDCLHGNYLLAGGGCQLYPGLLRAPDDGTPRMLAQRNDPNDQNNVSQFFSMKSASLESRWL